MDVIELAQKVAVLENEIKGMKQDIESFYSLLKEHMEKEEEERKIIMEQLKQIQLSTAGYKGIIVGVSISAAVVSTITSFAIALAVKFL